MSPGRDARTGTSRPARVAAAVVVLITAAAAACAAPERSGSAPAVPSFTAAPDAPVTPTAPVTTTVPVTTAAAPRDRLTITIARFLFAPETVTVPAGATVTVDNQDGANHTVTANDGSFDTGNIDGGAVGTFVAPTRPGTYPYTCAIHPFMTGTLTVT